MRQRVASLFVIGCLLAQILSSQATAADQEIRACSLLTKELALKVSTAEGKLVVENAKVYEDVMGPNSCKRGRITLMMDPFAKPDQYRKSLERDLQPVAGIGQAAFFNADSVFGNLYVFNGARNFHIQISLGPDDTKEIVKANATTLAKEVLAKLR